jgi:hypothetical protein
VLASYAHSDQTSPVRRGVFVRERLLCQEMPTPPPNAATIPVIEDGASTRERFAQHSADPSCSACHRLIDPVGFGFEAFDAIGRHRTTEAGQPVDASGVIEGLDGGATAFDGLPELAASLAASSEAPACFARQAYRQALGGLEGDAQRCDLERLASAFAAARHDIRELLVAITQLDSFRYRR